MTRMLSFTVEHSARGFGVRDAPRTQTSQRLTNDECGVAQVSRHASLLALPDDHCNQRCSGGQRIQVTPDRSRVAAFEERGRSRSRCHRLRVYLLGAPDGQLELEVPS
ncbi:MAG: hypothetical protein U0905_16835 [Pirellulales bacterium]